MARMEGIAVFQACLTAERHQAMRVQLSAYRATRTDPDTCLTPAMLEALRSDDRLRSGEGQSMTSVSMAVLAFACALSGATIGMAVRWRLPEHHLSRESIDVVKLATGLVATLVALVLSLLISSANSARVTVENEYKAGGPS